MVRDAAVRVAIAVLVLLAVLPGTAAALDTRAGGQVVVDAEETVGDSVVTAGVLEVRGTVDGDLRVYAGRVVVTESGQVTGDLEAAAGRVVVDGTVEGDLRAVAGATVVGETGSVGQALQVGAGRLRIDGRVGRDASVVAGTIRIGPSGAIGGDLAYDGSLHPSRTTVARQVDGQVRETSALSAEAGPLAAVPWWVVDAYWFVANLLAATVLLLLFPRGTERAVERLRDTPLRPIAAGLLAVGGGGLLAVLLVASAIGLPIGVAIAALLLVVAWIGSLLTRYVIGVWLCDRADVDIDWRGFPLVVGFLVTGILGALPVVGLPVRILIALPGVGVIVAVLLAQYREAEWTPRGGGLGG